MSRQTPRKSRHRHHGSSGGPRQIPASDYESDAAQYMENNQHNQHSQLPPARDNNELSLRVLRRYQPGVRSIMAIAANAVAYTFSETTQGWEKHGAEGTMFVCEQEPVIAPTSQVLPRVCVFVLNRRSMENLVIDLLRVTDCEVVGELIVFRLEDDSNNNTSNGNHQAGGGVEEGPKKKILGLWIHADESNTREMHATLILAAWQEGRLAFDAYIQAATAGIVDNSGYTPEPQSVDVAGHESPAGKRLSMEIPALIQTQISLSSSFEQWLARKTQSDGDHGGVIGKILSRLGSYKKWLEAAEKSPHQELEAPDSWVMGANLRVRDDSSSVIAITGPGSGETLEIIPKDNVEAKNLMSCGAFSKSQESLRSLLHSAAEIERETALLNQPPDATVKTYIQRLQEYNEIKDIGQQLIGFIAENRGVPVRTIYENGEFGVSLPRDPSAG
ncbi:uncharacterized protein C8A04DRAFT_40431 [Dichotomopilus funicola]|uniref:Uncharacterized protein n=1 Tax=Dichotomopilus funicola TaxID=1934379 RepID=A0AAN6UVM2_9PEZI|nr:hypothetical protein C8A04DRAFT_40431 [Dichotomopilus funicola]